MNEYEGTLEDYAELAVQFGYTSLFVVSFSLAPIFAYLSAIAEIRSDLFKVVNICRRMRPTPAEDIGIWQTIFWILIVISVWTNVGLICFTQDLLSDLAPNQTADGRWVFDLVSNRTSNAICDRVHSLPSHHHLYSNTCFQGMFTGVQWLIFIVMAIAGLSTTDYPVEVGIQLQRQEFVCSKLIEKVPDDHASGMHEDHEEGDLFSYGRVARDMIFDHEPLV